MDFLEVNNVFYVEDVVAWDVGLALYKPRAQLINYKLLDDTPAGMSNLASK